MENARIIKIFLASPSDVKPEREIVFALKDDIDQLIGKPNKLRFEFVNWERSAYPGFGDDAQDVINFDIGNDFDIFIGIFWLKFGTPTNRAESGTKEEFEIAFEKYKSSPDSNHIMLYFKTAAPANVYDIDYSQFEKVKLFKSEVQRLGALYWEFEKPTDLRNLLLIHLSLLVRDKFSLQQLNREEESIGSETKLMDKYDLLVAEIDKGKPTESIEGILDLVEQGTDSINLLPNITDKLVNVITFITNKFNEKTKEIEVINRITDDRLRLKRVKQIIDRLAIDLDDYSTQLNSFMPEFSETLNSAIESITKVIFLTSEFEFFDDDTKDHMLLNFPEIFRSVDDALDEIANFLRVLSSLPVMTSKFGASKRTAELATNNLLKEFVKAKKIMHSLQI